MTSEVEGAPYEVHIVVFPSDSAFDSYAADPETRALAPRRVRIVARTTALTGRDIGHTEGKAARVHIENSGLSGICTHPPAGLKRALDVGRAGD